jgi:hypothetical protein
VGAEIERPPDPEPLTRLRADDGGGAGRAHRVEVCEQLRFGPGTVLEVDDQPVEAGPGDDLGRER